MHENIELTEEERDGGFTLVELLIVIVILGILAAVTVFAVGGITNNAKENACATDLRTLEVAVESHVAQAGTPPANAAALVTAGLLREGSIKNFTITNGNIAGDQGSDCAAFSSSYTVVGGGEGEGG